MWMIGAMYLIQKKIALNSGSCNLFRLVNSSREIFQFQYPPDENTYQQSAYRQQDDS